ncbi:MAG: Rrf2 family transcriptional regulator [Planctomycetota bacterium]|nr:MAG: Rrf2 family transcriptional regulator [Planctomycetota bacterium]
MLSFSKTTGYAVLALGCLEASGGKWVLSQQISACTGVPMPYLRKILHSLSKAGLVDTKRGYQGGFCLARPADEIRLIDVIEAVEGIPEKTPCLLGLTDCNDSAPCPLHPYAGKLRDEIRRRLEETTVASVAEYARLVRSELLRCRPNPRLENDDDVAGTSVDPVVGGQLEQILPHLGPFGATSEACDPSGSCGCSPPADSNNQAERTDDTSASTDSNGPSPEVSA